MKYDEDIMCRVKANSVVFTLVCVFLRVRDTVTEPGNSSETEVQCYACQHDDPDAKRNVVSICTVLYFCDMQCCLYLQ